MEATGQVPAGTAATVRARAAGKLDPARIPLLTIEATTRHDVIRVLDPRRGAGRRAVRGCTSA